MTEQEASNILKADSCYECTYGANSPVDCVYGACRVSKATKMAIKALEEVQQYRAMEKRLEAIYGDCPGLLETVVEHLERHDGIGIDKPAFKARLLTDDNVDKWDSYKEIGTVEECRAAVEKQKPKKPIDRCMYKECPACGSVEIQNCGYCTECGQKLDWSDEE